MTYGIVAYGDNTETYNNLDPANLGGVVFLRAITVPAGTTIFYDFDGVSSHTYLKIYITDSGSHTIATSTVDSKARITFTAFSSFKTYATSVLVFTTQTIEPDYGIVLTNSAGERLASALYPVPKYQGKITFSTTPDYTGGIGFGESGSIVTYTALSSLGAGTDRLILWTLPNQSTEVWFWGTSYVSSSLGNFYATAKFLVPNGGTYTMPEALVFSLNNYTPTSDTYGLRLYDGSASNKLTFDSNSKHMVVKEYADIVYSSSSTPGSITSSYLSSTTAAILIPSYMLWQQVGITGQIASYLYEYVGAVRRVDNTLYSKRILIYKNKEDAYSNNYQEFGSAYNTIFIVDASSVGAGTGGSSSPPLIGEITTYSGSNSCTYDPAVATNCTTSQVYSIAVSGGNGTALTYSWSITSGTGFTISGSTSDSTVTVVATGSGTLTGNLRCTVTQTGSSNLVVDYTMTRIHTGTGSPLTASITSSSATTTCSYSFGVYTYTNWVAEYPSELISSDTTLGYNIATKFYTSTGYIGNYGGYARYGLARKPDAAGLKFWTNFSRTQGVAWDSETFATLFYQNAAGSDFTRSITASKAFDNGTGNGDFYDRPVHQGCTTSESFTVSTAGGDGTTKSYAWSFSSNPGGFSFTTGTTGTSVGISLTANGTVTYTATLACTVTQGTSSTTAYYNISHTHTANSTTYTTVGGYDQGVEAIDATSGYASASLVLSRDGSAIAYDQNGGVLGNFVWVEPQSSTVGDLFYVRFTRGSTSGIPTYGDASTSTGWLQLNSTRTIQAYCITNDSILRTVSAYYTIEFSNNASTVLSSGQFLLRAKASNSYL